MTTKEAIRILDPETTAEALAEIEYYAGFSGQTAKVQAVNDACEIAVSALRDQQETGWISVEERLPERDESVLILCKNKAMFTGYQFTDYEGESRWKIHTALSSTKLLNRGRVTHWMYLPETPKEEV